MAEKPLALAHMQRLLDAQSRLETLSQELLVVTEEVSQLAVELPISHLCTPIDMLPDLSARTRNALKQDPSIRFLGDLVRKSERELLRRRNLGRKGLHEIVEMIESLGFSLDMDLPHEVLEAYEQAVAKL